MADRVHGFADRECPKVLIRPPIGGVIAMVGWLLVLCAAMVLGALNEHDDRELLLVVAWLPWLVAVLLVARSRIEGCGNELTYRGPLRTRSWRRSEIGSFAVQSSRWSPRMRRIEFRTSDGERIVLGVTMSSGRRAMRRLERWLGDLEQWRGEVEVHQ